jgi:hypothetical protein
VAAAVVFAVGGPAVAVFTGDETPNGETVAATDPSSGMWAEVTTLNRAWGSEVDLKVKNAPSLLRCRLVAVGRDDSEQVVLSWTVPEKSGAAADAKPSEPMQGAAALHADEVARYEVRNPDGEPLVTLKAR